VALDGKCVKARPKANWLNNIATWTGLKLQDTLNAGQTTEP